MLISHGCALNAVRGVIFELYFYKAYEIMFCSRASSESVIRLLFVHVFKEQNIGGLDLVQLPKSCSARLFVRGAGYFLLCKLPVSRNLEYSLSSFSNLKHCSLIQINLRITLLFHASAFPFFFPKRMVSGKFLCYFFLRCDNTYGLNFINWKLFHRNTIGCKLMKISTAIG